MEMSNKEKNLSQTNLIYGVDDNPTLGKKVLFGLQHIFAAFSGIVVVPLVIAGSLGFDSSMTTSLISASILAAGLATIIQAYGIGPVGFSCGLYYGDRFYICFTCDFSWINIRNGRNCWSNHFRFII